MSTTRTRTDQPTASQSPLQLEITRIVHHALAEDLGVSPETIAKLAGTKSLCEFDATTSATVDPKTPATAELVAKQPGVIAALFVAKQVFETVDPATTFEELVPEGSVVSSTPTVIARVKGTAQAILVAERTALNIIQRTCGIATATKQYADKVSKHGILVLDTRKTTPGMRLLEKYAVRIGGGTNHRTGLYDAILIKDNHIRIAGGITAAIKMSRQKHQGTPLEVEVTNQEELQEAIAASAEKILLDNMSPDQIRESVRIIDGRAFIEVSGGVNLSNIDGYLIPGVNAISVGALTHSVRSLDISLEIEA